MWQDVLFTPKSRRNEEEGQEQGEKTPSFEKQPGEVIHR